MADYQNPEKPLSKVAQTNTEKLKTGSMYDFNLNVYRYPQELGSEAHLQQYVLFNINVRGKSTFNTDQRLYAVKRENTAQLTQDQLGDAAFGAAVVGGAAVGAGVASVATKFAGQLTDRSNRAGQTPQQNKNQQITKNLVQKGAVVAGTALGAAAGAALAKSEFLKPDTSYRIKDSIALYINDPPSVRYNAQYSNKDLGTLAGLVGAISGVDSLSSLGGVSGEGAQALALQFAKLPSALGVGSPAEIIGASAKVAMNPFKEVLFESIDFRTFAFKYRFLPKSKKEAEDIKKIIDTFKFHMHPELSTNKLFFIYPSEFQITYYYGNNENEYFHKFKPCALESMDVTYGGDVYSSFYDPKAPGYPTEVNLSLTFRETEILTKQQIMSGY